MRSRSAMSVGLGLISAATTALVYRAFRRDIHTARKRISSGSSLANTRCGPIEYAESGNGFPLLVIHGAGGGFDQLRGFESAAHLSQLGFRLIFVSRFGYLRTPLPADASTKAQADAHAALLDFLRIQQAAVIAVSAGAPSGLRFAAEYPERCAALALLVPAAFVPGLPETTPNAPPLTRFLRDTILKSDFAFWAATRVVRAALVKNILGTPVYVDERASELERRRLDQVLMDILPISMRYAGLLNDAQVVTHLEAADTARIKVPTLMISSEDDGYGTFRSARYLAGRISGSRLVIYPEGGHLWIGHDAEVQKELRDLLRPLGRAAALV